MDPASGDIRRTIEGDYPPHPVTDEDWNTATVQLSEAESREGPFECDVESMRPEFRPVVWSLFADGLGRLWVEAAVENGHALAIFDAEGRPLGEIEIPDRDPRVTPFVQGGSLYLVTKDETDVQSVEVFRLPTI